MVSAIALRASTLLRALTHAHRLEILSLLCIQECSVGEIEKYMELPQPAVSQQLARLRADGLVHTRRDGRTIFYSADKELLSSLIGDLSSIIKPDVAASRSQDAPQPHDA